VIGITSICKKTQDLRAHQAIASTNVAACSNGPPRQHVISKQWICLILQRLRFCDA